MEEKENQVIVVITTLLEATADKDEIVREAVNTSLRKIAKKYPNEVLKNAALYRKRSNKMSLIHLSMILKTMKQICEEHLADIDEKTVAELVDFSVEEMTRNKDFLPASQLPASNILVALGQGHCNKVMEGLLRKFEPGVIPHYAVMHTMGSLATANIFGIVPFVKPTLGTMLPMMAMLKQDSYKQVFAFALGRFSDAICEYIVNIDYAPDNTVRKESFNAEISIAYDILTNSWVNIKDPKVVEEVLLAIAPMFSLLPSDKMLDQSTRLVLLLFALYKKNVNPYPITQCLGAVLHSISIRNRATFEPQLDTLLNIMFDLVCTSPDYAQPHTIKTHYEVLRCFETIATSFCDRLVELCIQQTRNNNERERVKALHVITHLTNSSESIIRSRIGDLLTAVKTMLNDSSIKVKRAILKAIVAFACKGHLFGYEARPFIEFIVKNSCTQTPINSRDPDWASLADEFRECCSSTLYLLSSTVPSLESTLWPLLLQLYTNVSYTECSATIARCLAQLSAAGQPKKDSNEKIPVELPSGPEILARSLCLLGAPLGGQRGLFVLKFLEHHISHISRHLRPVWDKKLSSLTSMLESKDGWDETAWEEQVFTFLETTITEMDALQWTDVLGERFVLQANQYSDLPVEHAMALKCLAVVTSRSDERLVRQTLEACLHDSRQHTLNDSKASARAVGILSRRHAPLVLERLRVHAKEELNRRPSRLLGLMKDTRQEEGTTRSRITLLLCYAESALEAPVVEFLPHVDSDLAPWLLEQLAAAKDATTRLSALQALGNLAGALHPNRNASQVLLARRGELVASVLSQLGTGLDAGPLILDTATAFLKLPPELPSDECHVVLATCFERTFQLIDSHATSNDTSSSERFHWPRKLRNVLNSLASLISEVMTQRLGPAVLDDVWIVLENWLPKGESHFIRLAAVQLLRAALQCYLDNLKFNLEGPSSFTHSGLLVGRAVARCADVWPPVRPAALDCVGLTLQLAARYEGKGILAATDNDAGTTLISLRNRLTNQDELSSALNDLAALVAQQLPHYQLIHLAESLLDAMDGQTSSSFGATQVLRTLISNKGGELYHHSALLLDSIISKLQNLNCTVTRESTLQAVLALAKHHPKTVITSLLSRPIPFDNSVIECWQVLVQDNDLATNTIESLLILIQNGPLCEMNHTGKRVVCPGPFAAICGIQALFKMALIHDIALNKFPEIFSTIFLSLATYMIELKPKELGPKIVPSLNPCRETLHAFQRFLLCINCDRIAETMLQFASLETSDSTSHFIEYIPSLVRSLCSAMPQYLANVITCLNQHANSSQESRRIAVMAFYSELVSCKGNGELVLLDGVICTLLASLNDPCGLVRQLSLEGLAATSKWEQEQMSRYTEQIVSALVQGLDDHEASVAIPLVAMRGFSQLLSRIEPTQVANLRMTIALRIKPFFAKEDAAARAASLRVLGDLARVGEDIGGDFFEQTQSSLACLLLHLNDNDPDVVLACKYALREVAKLLTDAPRVKNLLLEHLIDEAILYYPEFISDLCKLMAEELPHLLPSLILHALTFLKSHWPTVRADAAMLVGVFCSHLTASNVKDNNRVSVETVCPKLFQLLRDEDQLVRSRAAHALSALFVS